MIPVDTDQFTTIIGIYVANAGVIRDSNIICFATNTQIYVPKELFNIISIRFLSIDISGLKNFPTNFLNYRFSSKIYIYSDIYPIIGTIKIPSNMQIVQYEMYQYTYLIIKPKKN